MIDVAWSSRRNRVFATLADLTSHLIPLAAWATVLGAAVVATGAVFADRHPALDLMAQGLAPGFSACVVALIAVTLVRKWRAAAALAIATATLLVLLQGQWFPSLPPARAGVRPVRIYFANVGGHNSDARALQRSIRAANPDVVALVGFNSAQAAAQDRTLAGYRHVVGVIDRRYENWPRALIAARYAFTHVDRHGVMNGFVDAPWGRFKIVLVHATRPWPFRPAGDLPRQGHGMAAMVRETPGTPMVLAGDFNATLSGATLKTLMRETGMRPAPARVGDWPSVLPGPFRVAIENAFVSPELTVTSRKLGLPNGSDHRPVVIEVAPAARGRRRD